MTYGIFGSLVLEIYGLFKMVFDCLWVVVDAFEVVVKFFEVVLGGCSSFLLSVTTAQEITFGTCIHA